MTIYYVDGAVGNDGNLGTSEGAGNAWATIGHAMTQVVAGDKVWVKASATYNETVDITIGGVNNNWIEFEGYLATTGDKGKVTWDGTGFNNCLTDTTSFAYYVFKNFLFTLATFAGVQLSSAFWFVNCSFNNNGGGGIITSSYVSYLNCESKNNGQSGMILGSTNNVVGCEVANNTQIGINVSGSLNTLIYKTLIYGNSNTSDTITQLNDFATIIACTIDGNATTGTLIKWTGTGDYPGQVMDNILYNGNYAVAWTGFGIEEAVAPVVYNLINNMTTGDYDIPANSSPLIGYGSVSGAPNFTNPGTGDYTLDTGSVAIDTGIVPGTIT